MECSVCRRAMQIIGTDKGIPTYYCEHCEIREGANPIKETYRKGGKIYECAYTVHYSHKEGSPLNSDGGWYRTKRIIYEREAEDFPDVGLSSRQ